MTLDFEPIDAGHSDPPLDVHFDSQNVEKRVRKAINDQLMTDIWGKYIHKHLSHYSAANVRRRLKYKDKVNPPVIIIKSRAEILKRYREKRLKRQFGVIRYKENSRVALARHKLSGRFMKEG